MPQVPVIDSATFITPLDESGLCVAGRCDGQWACCPESIEEGGSDSTLRVLLRARLETTKDYMEANGFVFAVVTPRQLMKDAIHQRYLRGIEQQHAFLQQEALR